MAGRPRCLRERGLRPNEAGHPAPPPRDSCVSPSVSWLPRGSGQSWGAKLIHLDPHPHSLAPRSTVGRTGCLLGQAQVQVCIQAEWSRPVHLIEPPLPLPHFFPGQALSSASQHLPSFIALKGFPPLPFHWSQSLENEAAHGTAVALPTQL